MKTAEPLPLSMYEILIANMNVLPYLISASSSERQEFEIYYGANPKEVLVSSVTTCYTTTLVFVLESRKLPVVELTVDSGANISENEFKITHHPHIVLSSDATQEQIESAH
ncbi:OsmC family protein [Neobacillus sp. PS3-12]|uniref:OsmC family protein n=1 Tax=Neobacillus sp. PS3-12 TaxID=3070677 RepID=UPI0027E1CFAB|nr:OsmC family protein [Neobacillus sp. PS3-12]WML50904.1 OsmC family protein [Neobacillus sp. PS3-12]